MRTSYLALATAGCLWGTSFLCGKIAFRELSVAHMLLYRFLFASIGLVPIVWLAREPMPKVPAMPLLKPLLAAALFGVPIQFLVQFSGVANTTVSHASLMIGTLPMLLALAAMIVMGERLDRRGWLAIVGSTVGVALITISTPKSGGSTQNAPTLIGDGLVLLSLFAAVVWVIVSKRLLRVYPPLLISSGVLWIGSLMLVIWVLLTAGPPPLQLSRETWLALAFTGLFGTSATVVLWNWGLARVPASHAGVFANLEPVIGAILGVTVLHETLGHLALTGGLLIIAAAIVMSIGTQPQ